MDFFEQLSRLYLHTIPNGTGSLAKFEFIPFCMFSDGRDFGINYKGYDGRMAVYDKYNTPENKPKLGYFDFEINTDNRYLDLYGTTLVTHYVLFCDLIRVSNINSCIRIWRGESPFNITYNIDEQQALLTLSLCMFEQEVNWGNNIWQKRSNFNRPRDMIMGFLKQAFSMGIDEVKYWRGSSAWFSPLGSDGTFYNYDKSYKKYFAELLNDKYALPLMSGPLRHEYESKLKDKPLHP